MDARPESRIFSMYFGSFYHENRLCTYLSRELRANKNNSYLIHLRLVSDRSVEIVAVSSNLLSRH